MAILQDVGLVCLTAAASLVVLFGLAKLMGARQISQMTMFDYTIGISIGSIAAEMASDLENPARPLTAMAVYALAACGISLWTSRSLPARRIITGKPLVLLDKGVLYRDNLKKARLDLSEFLTYCRMSGYFDLTQLQTAVMEHNGTISFLPREQDRPATPADLKLNPRQSVLQLPFVLDGVLLRENVHQAGKEEAWVHRALLRQGYRDEREVLLALWDGGEELAVFPMTPAGKEPAFWRIY